MHATGVGSARASRRLRWAGIPVTLLVLSSLSSTPAVAAPARVPGIDVSKWQGDVDWAAVAATNLRFVVIRSTIGDWSDHPFLEVDPRYLEYVDGATTNGLVVGAYHRANGPTDRDLTGLR